MKCSSFSKSSIYTYCLSVFFFDCIVCIHYATDSIKFIMFIVTENVTAFETERITCYQKCLGKVVSGFNAFKSTIANLFIFLFGFFSYDTKFECVIVIWLWLLAKFFKYFYFKFFSLFLLSKARYSVTFIFREAFYSPFIFKL